MANSVDPDQTTEEAVWSGYKLFTYAILSETLLHEILRTFTIIRKKIFETDKT